MGKNIVAYYKGKIKKEWKIAFFSTLAIGILIHIYKFTNTLPNRDAVYNYYADQNIVGSGRWFLTVASGLSSWFDLPWINGLLSIIFIGIAAAVIVDVFDLQNPVLIGLIAALLVSFPGITETFFFEYTADGYMVAMLLAALAVRVSKIRSDRKKSNWVSIGFAMVCICFTCGIYQSYVSFALILAICYFVYELLEDKYSKKEYMRWIGSQAFIYGVGLVSYYVIWKVCLVLEHTQVNHYQGIDQVVLDFKNILLGIKNSIKSTALFFFQYNVLEQGWTLYAVLNAAFLVSLLIVLYAAVRNSGLWKRHFSFAMFILAFVAIPFAACIWYFASQGITEYRPMMLQSLCLLYIFEAILADRWLKNRWSNFIGLLLSVIVFNFGIQANICYYYLDKCHEFSYAMGAEMMTRIHMLDEGNLKKIAIVGTTYPQTKLQDEPGAKDLYNFIPSLEKNILFNQEHAVLFLEHVFECKLSAVGNSELEKLGNSPEVKNMDNWPAKDSIQVIGETVVIKLAEVEDSEE